MKESTNKDVSAFPTASGIRVNVSVWRDSRKWDCSVYVTASKSETTAIVVPTCPIPPGMVTSVNAMPVTPKSTDNAFPTQEEVRDRTTPHPVPSVVTSITTIASVLLVLLAV